MESQWIVVEIGCIECGCSSNLAGVFETKAEAEAEMERLAKQFRWHQGGQNYFDVWECPRVPWKSDLYTERSGE